MSNSHTGYRVKFHIKFLHDNGRTEIIDNDVIIESRSPEEAEKLLLDRYENSDDPLTDFPDGWYGHINSEELVIDEIRPS